MSFLYAQDVWLMELESLIRMEMVQDHGYRALQWYAAQVCLWMKNSDPKEGYGCSGLGFIFQMLQETPHFGSAAD